MKSRRALLTSTACIAILVAVLLLLRGGRREKEDEAVERISKSEVEAPPALEDQRASTRRSTRRAPEEENSRPMAELKDSLVGKLKSLEAARMALLSEKRKGTVNMFLLGVTPPSPDEVKEIRRLIADLQRACSKEDLEQWDTDVRDILNEYDAFGEKGNKVIAMRVLDGKDDNLEAVVFVDADFDKTKQDFESRSTVSGTGHIYSYPPDRDTLKRFAAMMTSE